jgi:hypothetical protein
MVKYARIRHDDPPRQSNAFRVYPETVPMSNSPRKGKGVVIPYSDEWEMWTRSINTKESGDWLFTPHTMLFNIEYTDTPLAESICNAGNVVRVVDETDDYVKISRWMAGNSPVDAATYFNRPFLIHKVCCMDRLTLKLRKPDNGKDVYFPILTRESLSLWIDKTRIEFFPTLPLRVTVTILDAELYRNPSLSAGIVGKLSYMDEVTILEYRPQGASVWGMTDKGYWILLQQGESFFTTWRMKTLPPP